MRSSAGWIAGGVVLVLAGLILGVLITVNYDWSPPSVAQDRTEDSFALERRVSVTLFIDGNQSVASTSD